MATQPKPIPGGRNALTPYITVKNAAAAIDFYKKVFGATELMRMADSDGKVGHAELKIGDAVLMLSDEFPEYGVRSPETIGGTPVTLSLYVEDVDAIAAKVVAEGAKVLRPVEDQFYGDRAGKFEDPFGHHWWLATHQEDVSAEEMKRRAADKYGMS
jgi:PhnB protein